jgi:predicted hydrocarbon binding protein
LRFVGGLLYTASKKAGAMTAERLVEKGLLSEGNALELLLWTFVASGYASKVVVERVETGRRDTKLYLAVYDTLLGSRLRDRKRPVDQPLAGFLAGWLEKIYGVKVDGKEVKCASQGHDHCEFEIKIHKRMPELEKYSGYSVGGCRG